MKSIRYSIMGVFIAMVSMVSCQKSTHTDPLIADAGIALVVKLPIDTVTLSGIILSGQTPDMHYLWSVISGPAGSSFANNTTAITIVRGLVQGAYVFQFQITNDNGEIAVDTVSVLVTARPLVVDAGSYHSIQLPTDTLTLNGTVVTGQTANMHYLWSLVSGPSGSSFRNNTAASTTVSGLIAGTYVFQFQAINGDGNIAVDTASINVFPFDSIPVNSKMALLVHTRWIYQSAYTRYYGPTGNNSNVFLAYLRGSNNNWIDFDNVVDVFWANGIESIFNYPGSATLVNNPWEFAKNDSLLIVYPNFSVSPTDTAYARILNLDATHLEVYDSLGSAHYYFIAQ